MREVSDVSGATVTTPRSFRTTDSLAALSEAITAGRTLSVSLPRTGSRSRSRSTLWMSPRLIGDPVSARPAQSAGAALGHAAAEVSLLREEHRAEARVWLAFVAQTAVSKTLASTLKANYATLQEAFTRLISEAGEDAERAVPLDPRREARTLLALADGLTTHVLIGHLAPHEAHDVLHAHLTGLWEQPARPPHTTANPSNQPAAL
ncbi:TetR family transcriptional regulator C-terminal domain-containing protein [Streptomyces sp. NEAU-W12]|uniref:TetR family transcriptional regulator C-terminal domain-containing protein n=1 Tax=Streptomyces sp. NEAU-W12 TaxID=2994668 RepID=UPI003A4C5A44